MKGRGNNPLCYKEKAGAGRVGEKDQLIEQPCSMKKVKKATAAFEPCARTCTTTSSYPKCVASVRS